MSFEDEEVNAGDVQLAGMVSITGLVESETGLPISGEILTLTTQARQPRLDVHRIDWGFSFDSLPMGTYTLARSIR